MFLYNEFMSYLLLPDKKKFNIEKDIVKIGKHPDNDIKIDDPKVSRFHAEIRKKNDEYMLIDLNSTNGTFLNGNKIKEAKLFNAYKIRIGNKILLFFDSMISSTILDKTDITTVILKEVTNLNSIINKIESGKESISQSKISIDYLIKKVKNNVEKFEKIYQKLLTLYEITNKINSSLDLSIVLNNVIDSALEFSGAKRGFIILFNRDRKLEIKIARSINKSDLDFSTFKISKTIASEVAKKGEPIITENAYQDIRFSGSESIMTHRTSSSIICLPMIFRGKTIGALYLDNTDKNVKSYSEEVDFLLVLANQAALAIENARFHIEEVNQAYIKQELKLAYNIQKQILPSYKINIGNVDFYAHSLPAKEVGGDYYHFFINNNRLIIIIADVSGKSLSSALIVAMFHSTIKALLKANLRFENIFEQINSSIINDIYEGMYVTAFLLEYNFNNNTLLFQNAGHNPPLLYKKSLNKIFHLRAKGLPIGLFENSKYEVKSIKLNPGDSLLLYTDGITECFNNKGQIFGEKRLNKLFKEIAQLPSKKAISAIFQSLKIFRKNKEQSDDITAFFMRIIK